MSGGHYNYAYHTLEDLAEQLDASPHDEWHDIRVKTSKILKILADICKDIEWEDSGDGANIQNVKVKFEDLEKALKKSSSGALVGSEPTKGA